jgi:hypothetical protein
MRTDEFKDDDQAGDEGDSSAEETIDALADDSGDTAFVVTEEKQPLSKGTVAMFVLLAVAGAGTYFMYARSGPQTASAAVDPKAQQVISKYMTDRDKNLAGMKKMLRDTETVVKQFLKYPSVSQVPLSDLTGNPFRVVAAAPEKGAGDPGQAAALSEEQERKRREEERAAVTKAVETLQLMSVMHGGARRSCMINNTLYTEGQQVDGFTVEKINPNAVVVRSGAYRFELRMQR